MYRDRSYTKIPEKRKNTINEALKNYFFLGAAFFTAGFFAGAFFVAGFFVATIYITPPTGKGYNFHYSMNT
jgi:hypothetical protein